MNENTVTLTLEEYEQLARKAWKFDILRNEAKKSGFLNDVEKLLFELPEKDGE